MKISTKGRYALRVMIDLAMCNFESNIKLKDISERQEISLKYLEQIMRLLSSAKLVKSVRGANGGYRIARAASMCSVKEILEVCEGSLAPVDCVNDNTCCERCSSCSTVSFWQGFNEHINSYLSNITIQDIIEDNNKKNKNYDYII